jgi:hypothetical protein
MAQLQMFHGMFHRARQGTLSSQARDSIATFKRSLNIAGIQVQSNYKRNQLAIGGEGVDREIIFVIAIH